MVILPFCSYGFIQGMPECIKPYCRVGDNLDVASRYMNSSHYLCQCRCTLWTGSDSQVIFYRVCLNV